MEEKKELKNKLQFSELRFEAIAQTASDSIVISDEDSKIIFANKKAHKTFGYEAGELTGLNLGNLMPQKYRQGHEAGVNRFIATEQPKLIGHTVEIEGLRKDSSIFPIELSLSSWKEEGKHFFSGIIRDISRRKQEQEEREIAARQLQEQQKELETAYEEVQASREEYQAANEELMASEEELQAVNKELLKKEALLKSWNSELEKRVRERTSQIERHREWLENLFMQVPALIGLLKGREGVVSLYNPMLSKLFGTRNMLGKTMREAWPELEGQGYFEFIENVYDSAKAVSKKESPAWIDRKNNGQPEQAYFNFIYAPYYDTSGAVEGVIIYAEDVSEQVFARKAIEESAERFYFMANAMPQKVWTARADGDTDYFNQKWLDYTGQSENELKGWNWKHIIHPDDWEKNERKWKYSIETGADYQLEHRFRRHDGKYRWHLSRGLAQRDEQGNIRRWVGTTTDIHDHKIAQEKLLQTKEELRNSNEALSKTNNDLDNFIYTASHDLRSPVVNLEGLIGLAKNKFGNKISAEDKGLLSMMETSILRLKKTISDLTEITKIQKGTKEEAKWISFKEILDEVKTDNIESIEEANALLEEEMEVEGMYYSRKDMRSIFYNLFSNAVKYRSPERRLHIRVKTYLANGKTVLSVSDNGLGISQQQLPKLFGMFKRLHTHVEGTGIGLYIVKRIVENNGGSIQVSSELNQGTTFCILFNT
jgi:PAS domain S-box-containing protein